MALPLIALVGRPNVGKSMLFNRFTSTRTAIVENIPGVTRDRIYGEMEWAGRRMKVVDTGGLGLALGSQELVSQVRQQAEVAIAEADLVLMLVDAREGITAEDEDVADLLRRSRRPVLLIANKVENYDKPAALADFYRLGLGEPIPISAMHGMNTGDVLDMVIDLLPAEQEETFEPDTIRVAVVGRPNVGKSSLVNRLLGAERVIVSDLPGTTRDAIDTPFQRESQHYVLVDTAGLRRQARVKEGTEYYSGLRTHRAIERADVVLVMLDATAEVAEQDRKIAGLAHEAGKSQILVINKWDLVNKDNHTMSEYDRKIRQELPFVDYAPIVYISALTGQRLNQLLDVIDFVAEQANRRVPTGQLNDWLLEVTQLNPPPNHKGKPLRLFYITQAAVKPPGFVLFVNNSKILHFSYKRYLENKARESFGFEGNPLRFWVRQKGEEGR